MFNISISCLQFKNEKIQKLLQKNWTNAVKTEKEHKKKLQKNIIDHNHQNVEVHMKQFP